MARATRRRAGGRGSEAVVAAEGGPTAIRDWVAPAAAATVVSAAPLLGGLYSEPLPALFLSLLSWIGLAAAILAGGSLPAASRGGLVAGVLFILVAIAGLLTSVNPGATFLQIFIWGGGLAQMLLAAAVAAGSGDGSRLRIVAAGALAGGLVTAIRALQEYGAMARAGDTAWRAGAGFTSPNFLAGYLAAVLLLAAALALHRPAAFRPALWRVTVFLGSMILTGGLAVTGSRGGAVALAVGLALFAVVMGRVLLRSQPDTRWSAASVAAGMLAAGLLLAAPLTSRQPVAAAQFTPAELCPSASTGATESSNQFRLVTWRDTAAMARERPLFGWGAGGFETTFGAVAKGGFTRHAHNSYLQLLAEGGILLLAPWLILTLCGAWGLWRAARGGGLVEGSMLAALTALSAASVFESLFYVPAAAVLYWSLIGTGLARPAEATPARLRIWGVAACIGAAITCWPLAGRLMLTSAEPAPGASPQAAALSRLRTAQWMLPWDHEVSRQLGRVLAARGDISEALAQAGRSVVQAPYRPAGYLQLSALRVFNQEPTHAYQSLQMGLEKAPRDLRILFEQAEIAERLGWRREALANYGAIVELERGELGQIRPLGEYRDFRFALAHARLARASEDEGEALKHRRSAACLLSERRQLLFASPWSYAALPGEWDPTRERNLLREEAELWEAVAEGLDAAGENRLAALAREQSKAALEATMRVGDLMKQIQEAGL